MAIYQAATDFMRELDADWANLIAQVGSCQLAAKPEREPYEALIRAVAYQQLHPKAGDAIIGRLLSLYDHVFPTPDQLLATDSNTLRACGFSARKIDTLLDIAKGLNNGLVPSYTEAEFLSSEELIARLITIKGIGQWTVEMMLIFTLGRMDILPSHDFGIREGYKRLKHLDVAPTPKALQDIGQTWAPYRTVASWYLWQVPK